MTNSESSEFSAGYTSILKLPSISDSERNTRLDHFIGFMYLVMQFTWPAVREFHATVLFEIECGRAWWGDSFSDLETRLLQNSLRSTGTALASRLGAPVLFCRDFQHGKCGHSKDHYGTIRNETKWLQHICAKCWTVSYVIPNIQSILLIVPQRTSFRGSPQINHLLSHCLPDSQPFVLNSRP